MKKLISVILSILMIISVVPLCAFAEEDDDIIESVEQAHYAPIIKKQPHDIVLNSKAYYYDSGFEVESVCCNYIAELHLVGKGCILTTLSDIDTIRNTYEKGEYYYVVYDRFDNDLKVESEHFNISYSKVVEAKHNAQKLREDILSSKFTMFLVLLSDTILSVPISLVVGLVFGLAEGALLLYDGIGKLLGFLH